MKTTLIGKKVAVLYLDDSYAETGTLTDDVEDFCFTIQYADGTREVFPTREYKYMDYGDWAYPVNDSWTKERIEEASELGVFLPSDSGYQEFADLDGSAARAWLESKGFEVVENRDTGRNGIAITKCGIYLSTNGYIHKNRLKIHGELLAGLKKEG